MNSHQLLPTSLVGSYPQPDWLIDREQLAAGVPRVRKPQLWRVSEPWLEQAQDDAVLAVILELERAGVDILTDGELRRESYSNRFANALSGIDPSRPGHVIGRDASRPPIEVPLISGPVRRLAPVEVRDLRFLRAHTDHPIKVTLPGPFTLSEQAENAYYPDRRTLALDFAAAINLELQELFAAGADVVQLDEPWMEARYQNARQYGVEVVNRALEGISGTTALHICFGYAFVTPSKPNHYNFLAELEATAVKQVSIEAAQSNLDLTVLRELPSKTIILGVIDLRDPTVEHAAVVAKRIEAALRYVAPERLVIAPDCGMKYLPRAVALGKIKAMVEGAAMVRGTRS
ncbi:MAG TPA: cobalamin-independent methionine synthase II family protein [Candidatus Binataceae bacterium]|nr:cobalamin-independent methionine synthase II family protein [Candidatus Binataceae bacterium]